MIKFWKLQVYEDMNFFKKLIFKYHLARQLKKMCKFQVFLDSQLNFRSEEGFNDFLQKEFKNGIQ